MNRYSMKALVGCVATAAMFSMAGTVLAVPYASGVVQTGNTVNYILNEVADTVTITRDGGNQLVFNAVAAGAASFDMTGFSTYSIEVTHSATAGWATDLNPTQNRITDPSNLFTNFDRPYGVAVNKNPGSADFGSTYVGQARAFTTGSGRTLTDGLYKLNADFSDAFGGAANDPAKDGGLDFSGSSFTSPWYLNVGADDTVYISDWSDPTGGVKYLEADLNTGGLLLAEAGDANANTTGNHGSFASSPVVTGSRGTDLQLWAIDEDRTVGAAGGTGNNIWNWNIGTDLSDSTVTPTLVVDASLTPADTDGGASLLAIGGVRVDLDRDDNNGNLIVAQNRYAGVEAGLMFFDSAGTLLWSSKQFTLDNGLDGFDDDLLDPDSLGIQDIFRQIQNVAISPDGKTLAVGRRESELTNSVLGSASAFTSGVLLIDLDPVTGLPVISTAGGVITGGISSVTIDSGAVNHTVTAVEWDLAGNLYIGNNVSELVEAFGPGGVSSAITASDGTFTINGVVYGGGGLIDGDLDADGFVGITDLNLILGNWNQFVTAGDLLSGDPSGDGFVGIDDLNAVLGNWNAGVPPTNGAVVPEPASLALLGLGGFAMLRRRRR